MSYEVCYPISLSNDQLKGKNMALLEWVASFSFSVLLLCNARRQRI